MLIKHFLSAFFACVFLSGQAVTAQTGAVDFSVKASGVTQGESSSYELLGQIDTDDGSFEGSYVFDVPGQVGPDTWRAAAKRGWDLKLRWGRPTNPPPIHEVGNFDLSIISETTMADTGARFSSDAEISGGPEVLDIALRYEEPAQRDGEGGLKQVSFSTFAGDGPGRILFQTSHYDDDGEFAQTRGVIRLTGAPKAQMDKPVHTMFTMLFEPGEDRRKGRFTGQTEVIPARPDLPRDRTLDLIFDVPTSEQKYCCELVCTTLNPSSCQHKCEPKGLLACPVFTVNCPNKLGDGGCKFE